MAKQDKVRACVHVCMRACMRACVHACVRMCVCMRDMHVCVNIADAYLIVDANMYTKCIRTHAHS